MAELQISDLIREHTLIDVSDGSLGRGSPKPEPTRWQKTKNYVSDKVGTATHWIDKKTAPARAHVQRNRGLYGLGTGAAAGAGLTLGGLALKKHLDERNSLKNRVSRTGDRINNMAVRAKSFGKAHGGKVAAGTAAALGAAVGTKALLKYLRKKKKSR